MCKKIKIKYMRGGLKLLKKHCRNTGLIVVIGHGTSVLVSQQVLSMVSSSKIKDVCKIVRELKGGTQTGDFQLWLYLTISNFLPFADLYFQSIL